MAVDWTPNGIGGMSSMFFAGLILLIPHRIGMSRVNYVIRRYNLPISRAGLLLYKYHNNIELSLLLGTFPGNIIVWIVGSQTIGEGIFQLNTPEAKNDVIKKINVAFLILMLLSSICMFIIYISGGDFGHLNTFYLTLILLTFFDGFTNAFAFAINPKYSSLYAAAIPISGFLVTLFHNVYKFISDLYHLDDFDYYVLFIQLIYNIFTLSSSLILWTVAVAVSAGDLTGDTPALQNVEDFASWKNHEADISPICMLAFSLGTVYAFYPSIAPYSIIDFQYASIIELWILALSSSPTLIFAILDFIPAGDDRNPIGPGQCNYSKKDAATSTTHTYSGLGNWSTWQIINLKNGASSGSDTTSNEGKWFGFYHLIWICAIPYILCIQIFMSMLHYPHSSLSSLFNHTPYRIGFISVLFNTLRELLQALGFAGAGKQLADSSNGFTYAGNVNGGIASMNKPITLHVMMFCVFTGDGYLQHYRRCCRDCWPTTGYNKYQSFFYWLHFGFKGGIKSITSSFTDLYYHNLRPQFISYA